MKATNRTILDVLYTHDSSSLVEFPSTSEHGRVGHLFHIDLQLGSFNPMSSFAYSQGEPKGSSGSKTVFCALLVDEEGNEVPCREFHSTCVYSIFSLGDIITGKLTCKSLKNQVKARRYAPLETWMPYECLIVRLREPIWSVACSLRANILLKRSFFNELSHFLLP